MILNNWYKKEKPFVSGTSTTGGAGGFAVGSGSGGGAASEFDFTGGSAPSGFVVDSGSGAPSLTFDSTGAKFNGDAASNDYRLRSTDSFTGDYLFQISTRIDQSSDYCNDAGMGLFNTTYNGSNWDWAWSSISGRIAVQNNCPQPYIYGQTGSSGGTSNLLKPSGDGGQVPLNDWITMHMKHEPTSSKTSYSITLGNKDWTQSGTRIQNWFDVADSFSGTYYWGITCDNDTGDTWINGARFEQL